MAQQADIKYEIKVSGKTRFKVVHFKHKEHLSKLFKTNLKLVSENDNPVFADILDNPVTLTLYKDDEPIRYINGIVTSLKQGKTGFRRSHYKMTIEPALSRADLIQDSRHYQNKTSQQIIKIILKQSGVSHFKFMQMSQAGKPQTREFCQQYRETNLNFIKRLAAEDGFYFYFEHKQDQHILHFADSTQSANRLGDLLYNPNPAGDRPEPCIWQADYKEKIAPTKMAMKDYNFKNPDYRLNQLSNAKKNEIGDYEIFDSPGRFAYNEAGKPFTQTRLEELRRDTVTIKAQGDDMRIVPGYRMKLKGHSRAKLNDEWTFVRVKHEGYQPGALQEEAGDKASFYKNKTTMIPWDTQYKATTRHKPVVDGPQIATVVGPEGEEIYTDEWARVKLQFEYDRYGKFDELSSCWIRVSQGWAGTKFGGMAIPRIGQEVIVNYLEGDPDQPIVTGRTFNANNLPPYPLPANKTRMTIKSNTHKGSGFNELRFEDEKDQQEVFIHAEKDQNNIVKNNETTKVGVDRSEDVGQNETISIGKDRSENVGNDETISIGHDRRENVVRDENVSIGKNQSNTIGNTQQNDIGKNKITKIGKDEMTNIGNSRVLDVYADQKIKSGGHYSHTVGGKTTWKSGEKIQHLTTLHIIDGSSRAVIKAPGGTIVLDAGGITLKGAVNIKGNLAITGGTPESVNALKLSANAGELICVECLKI